MQERERGKRGKKVQDTTKWLFLEGVICDRDSFHMFYGWLIHNRCSTILTMDMSVGKLSYHKKKPKIVGPKLRSLILVGYLLAYNFGVDQYPTFTFINFSTTQF